MQTAQVEFYEKDSLVFIKNRVGVITSGAIIICKHPNTSTGPIQIIKKSVEGDIIGFDEGDGGLTANPLTWFLAF